MLPWRDCTAWLPRLDTGVCLRRVNYTIYIFRNNTEYVNRDFHFIVGGVILYRPLYIHQVSSFSFSMLILFYFIHRAWHMYLYRPSVLLFNTIAGLIDFSTAPPLHPHLPLCTQSGCCSCAIWRELNSCRCDRSRLGEKKLWTFSLN